MSVIEQVVKNAVQTASTQITEKALEEFRKDITPSAEEVRQSARDLVKEARDLQIKHNAVGQQLASLDTSSEASVLNFSKKVVTSKKEYMDLMDKVYKFQNVVNYFMGKQVLMTFAYISPKTGKVDLFAFDADVEHLTPDQASKSHGGDLSGRYRGGVIKKNSSKLINKEYDEHGKKTLDNTFQEVWQRFKISKMKYKMGGAGYILWHHNNKWDGRWVSGAGPLGEAYVAFFMNEYVFTNMIESAVATFILHPRYGVSQVDNASGFLKGDVTKGQFELGVKIQGASAMSYIEIIQYAYQILQETDIKGYLESLNKKLADGVKNATKEIPQDIMANLQSTGMLDLIENRYSNGETLFSQLTKDIPIFK